MKAGWKSATIGATCDLSTGGTPSKARREFFDGGSIRWLVSGDVHQKEIFDCEGRITELGYENSNARFLPINSVIIALNGQGKTRGTVALLRTKATCNQSLVAISPRDADALDPKYLFYNLHSRYDEIRRMTGDGGDERRGLNMPLIRSIGFPLPSLHEQKRIVAVLDEAFEGLARARANAEANLADARELLESISTSAFHAGAQGWREASLGEVADFRNGLNFTRASKGQRIKIVGVGDFQTNRQVPVESLTEVVIDGELAQDDQLRSGDVLAVRSNGNKALIGRVMLVPETTEVISFSGFTIRVRLRTADILPGYLLEFMRSPRIRETLTSGGGSNISNLNQGQLSRLRIEFPSSKDDQRLILDRIDAAVEAVGDLQRQVESQQRDLNALRQSLLQKAFAGELT